MHRNLPWFLLAGSLLLNAFFIGGVVMAKWHVDDLRWAHKGRGPEVLDDLGLSKDERRAFADLSRSLQEKRQGMFEETAPLRRQLIDEMRQPLFDEARVADLLQQRSTVFVTHMAEVMSELHDLIGRLEPGKRDALFARMDEDPHFIWRLMRGPHPEGER